jgi:DNA-binding GntR family transcriptional regulator
MDKALADDDLEAWAAADEGFHRLLVELSGNQRLRNLVETFIDQAHRVRMVTLRLRPKPTASNKDHRAVVRAITKGDAGKARQIHHEHRERSGKLLADLLREHGLTQF